MPFALTLTPLRFTCEATTPLRLEVSAYRAGSNLRGALGQVMQRTYCLGDRDDPTHPATCPVCWLLAANERPGQERRGYVLRPPLSEPANGLQPQERFQFDLGLLGETRRFLPYFLLAIPEMGRRGLGPGRGRFALRSVASVNPFTGECETVLAEGERLVHTPQLILTHEQVEAEAARRTAGGKQSSVEIQFLTPMRLIRDDVLVKTPEFVPFFARLLRRLDELNAQFGSGPPRPFDEVTELQALAGQVQLCQARTCWVEVRSGSSRTGKPTWLSGFVGSALYAAPPEVWSALMPWLVWGELVQVGKDTVKGNGCYEVVNRGLGGLT